MCSISKKLENTYGMDIHTPRIMSLNFYIRLIEDMTNEEVKNIKYDCKTETLLVDFKYLEEKLIINIRCDSLPTVTRDVIRQTANWHNKRVCANWQKRVFV